MKEFFRNKFFYIMVTLALIFTIVPSVLALMGQSFFLRDAVNVLLTPLQKGFNAAAEAVDGFAGYFYRFDELVEENAELREQVSALQSEIYDAAELEQMYAWMSDFLDMKIHHTDFDLLEATVTGRESGNYARILTLDVGSGAGVTLNMPVVSADGIVGKVTEVGYTWSKVTTIVESTSSVGAYIERTGESGICEGRFELSPDGLCMLNYLPQDASPAVGDRVLSTGFGSVYPRGLTIGYVDSVEPNPFSRGVTVRVRCAADFSTLTRVMIVTGFEATAVPASSAVTSDAAVTDSAEAAS